MRDLKKELLTFLQSENFFENRYDLCKHPGRKIVNPIFSFFLHPDEIVRWHAITAMGTVVACLADRDMESARVVLRRLMWSLNDESGGIGWGAPEAIGEIIAIHEGLSKEYASVLISYIWEEGNYLEYEMLQRGALWGVGRAASARPGCMKDAVPHLALFLTSPDATIRGLSARALGFLDPESAEKELKQLLSDTARITLYEEGKLKKPSVKELAQEALNRTPR